MEDKDLLIVVDAVVLQVDQVPHLILDAVELVLVNFFVGDEEVAQDFVVIRGILAVLLQYCEDLVDGSAVDDVFEGDILFWGLVDGQYFG